MTTHHCLICEMSGSDPDIPPDLRGADTRDPVRVARRREITVALRAAGWSWRRIAEMTGVSESAARHRARRWAQEHWRT